MPELVITIILIFTLGGLFILSFSLIALIRSRGVPYVPLTKAQLRAVDKHVKLDASDKVVDLGCGDGRVLRMFEKQGVKEPVGYEINLYACVKAWFINKIKKSRTKVYYKDFNKVDLSKYDVLFCYLLPGYLERIAPLLKKQAKPGVHVISYGFAIAGWKPQAVIYTNKKNKKLGRIFIYKTE